MNTKSDTNTNTTNQFREEPSGASSDLPLTFQLQEYQML